MAIRSILVPVRGDGKHEDVLNHALALARRSGAHIDVVHCRPRAEDMLPYGVVVPAAVRAQLTASVGGTADAEEQRLKAVFQRYCDDHDCVLVSDDEVPPAGQLSIAWREVGGKQPAVVSRLGRLTDVIVLAQPDARQNLGYGTLEAALFETGHLVLMCPPQPVAALGRQIAFGWNGSAEAARAVSSALPLLEAADKVTVLAFATGEEHALPAAEAVRFLKMHGITPELRARQAAPSGVGRALLDEAAAAGADTLLIGAYGQSRLRELVMGGVTRFVVEHAQMPVLMTH